LKIYLNSITSLKDLLTLKNAQLEAQTPQELSLYLSNLKISLNFITQEIMLNRDFSDASDLMSLFRIISPESHEASQIGFAMYSFRWDLIFVPNKI
jgi:hypothetical protein